MVLLLLSFCLLALLIGTWITLSRSRSYGHKNFDNNTRPPSEDGFPLQDQYSDVIAGVLSTVKGNHELDLAVRKCLIEVTRAAGQERISPKTYDLDKWAKSAPNEYVCLLTYLRHRVGKHISEQATYEADKIADADRICSAYRAEAIERHRGLIERFLEIAYRKVSEQDEYGDYHWERLDPEIDIALEKMIERDSPDFSGYENSQLVRDKLLKSDTEFAMLDQYVMAERGRVDPVIHRKWATYGFRVFLRSLFMRYLEEQAQNRG